MNPKDLTDLQLAEVLAAQLEQLQAVVQNVKLLKDELARRKNELAKTDTATE